jgi:hypothetical protein
MPILMAEKLFMRRLGCSGDDVQGLLTIFGVTGGYNRVQPPRHPLNCTDQNMTLGYSLDVTI